MFHVSGLFVVFFSSLLIASSIGIPIAKRLLAFSCHLCAAVIWLPLCLGLLCAQFDLYGCHGVSVFVKLSNFLDSAYTGFVKWLWWSGGAWCAHAFLFLLCDWTRHLCIL